MNEITGAQRRNGYIAGVPCWVDVTQPDPEAALGFYGGLFGWEFEDRMPPEAPGSYFIARLNGGEVAAVSSPPFDPPPPVAWNTYVWVDSADDAAARAKEAGGSVIDEPFDVLEAGRMAVLADAQGATICAWEPKAHKGAQVVNSPGSWSWSDLSTTDPEAAAAFYGALFGWEADPVEGAPEGTKLMRLPGYGDFMKRSDPDLRKHLEDDTFEDAPPGFVDAVAWVAPPEGEGPEAASRWGVTFGVEDADASAARAAELGGRVIVEPFDAPPVRMAVLADPAGATFSIGMYDPERYR